MPEQSMEGALYLSRWLAKPYIIRGCFSDLLPFLLAHNANGTDAFAWRVRERIVSWQVFAPDTSES